MKGPLESVTESVLPGWETPKLRAGLFTQNYGLISDCFSEFCHEMRKYDYTDLFGPYFDLNSRFNTRDEIAVKRTFSGLAKLIYPEEKSARKKPEISLNIVSNAGGV